MSNSDFEEQLKKTEDSPKRRGFIFSGYYPEYNIGKEKLAKLIIEQLGDRLDQEDKEWLLGAIHGFAFKFDFDQ